MVTEIAGSPGHRVTGSPGIVRDCRFRPLKGKRELVVASCVIPWLKLSPIPDSSMRDKVTNNIKTELAAVTEPPSAECATSSAPEDFFSFGQQTVLAEAQYKLLRYLLVPVDYPLSQMKNFEGLNQVFL